MAETASIPLKGCEVVGSNSQAGPSKPKKKATINEMRNDLEQLGLDSKGKKATLWRRLVKAFQHTLLLQSQGSSDDTAEAVNEKLVEEEEDERSRRWKAFLCFDVEATCRGGKEFDWPNEIIEFPIVLLKWNEIGSDDSSTESTSSLSDKAKGKRKLERVDTFHSYVKPTWSPKLTDFCTSLTGITQAMVDESPTFPEMISLLEAWLDKHDLRGEDGKLKDAMWVTDGPWDLRDFIPKQLHISPIPSGNPPYFFSPYLNIKQATQTVLSEQWLRDKHAKENPGRLPPYARGRISTSKLMGRKYRETNWTGPNFHLPIPGQLEAFGLGEFEGRQHSGIDDSINVSRILIAMSERGVIVEPNSKGIHPNNMKKWPWMGRKPGIVKWEDWMSDNKVTSTQAKPSVEPEQDKPTEMADAEATDSDNVTNDKQSEKGDTAEEASARTEAQTTTQVPPPSDTKTANVES